MWNMWNINSKQSHKLACTLPSLEDVVFLSASYIRFVSAITTRWKGRYVHHILKGEVKYARKYDEALSSSPKI